MKILFVLNVVVVSSLLLCASAFALTYDNNITIYDGNSSADTGWNGTQEDNEVEPGMVRNQIWDLEGFFQDGDILSLVGGYNFYEGVQGYSSGDVFIDADGTPEYGDIHRAGSNGNFTVDNSYGYDFVFDLDFDTMLYNVVSIDEDTQLETAYYTQNEGSSPWQYNSVIGEDVVASGSFSFLDVSLDPTLTDADTGFAGGTHYALTGLDLSFLEVENNFYSHFTMGCGNDNLMGKGSTAPVPEPSTVLLLGSGLVGLAWYGRRRKGV